MSSCGAAPKGRISVFLMAPSSDHPSPAGIERMNHISCSAE